MQSEAEPSADRETGVEPRSEAEPGAAVESHVVDSEPVAEGRADQPGAGDEPTSETEAEAAPDTETETETKSESESEPVVTEESAEESAIEENVSAEPVAGTASEDTASEAPAAEETASEEPATEAEPAVEEPVAEEPAPEVAEEEESQAPQPEPEAEAAAEPEPEPAPEPAAAEATPAPEPVVEVVPDPEPEAAVEPTAEPEPEAEAEPVAVVVPAAAGGEDAPQGSPAVDDESGTGGAGGKEEDVPAALRSAYDAAGATLAAHELTGTTARTYLVLDRSASMRAYYKDGSAQALGEQTLALAAHLDPESTVHVIFFSTELDGTGELTLTEHENKIDDLHAGLGRMGRTSYHAAVEEVLAQHTKHAPDAPALVVFQTDGAPDAKTPATQALTDAAKSHPAVFFSFVAFGDPENKAFDYLRKLKLPNTSHFLAGETPKELTDAEVYEGILANWRP